MRHLSREVFNFFMKNFFLTKKSLSCLLMVSLVPTVFFSCQKVEEAVAQMTPAKTLYVATGACNSGSGITTYTSTTATRTIERFSTVTGASLGSLFDYASVQSGMPGLTYPAGVIDSGSKLYLLNEGGASLRSVILVPKASAYSYSTIVANNALALSSVLNGFTFDDQGSVLISKTAGIEKFNSSSTRLTASGSAWVINPGAACAATPANTTSVLTVPTSGGVTGHVIIANQGATSGTNRLSAIFGGTGYINTSNCLASAQINSTTHSKASNLVSGTIVFPATGTSPTSMAYVPFSSGTVIAKLLVTYSNNQTNNSVSGSVTTLNHGIVAWDVNQPTPATLTLTNPMVLVEDHNVVFAASAIAYDASSNSVYVAVGGVLGSINQTTGGLGYNIEKFSLDMTNASTTGPRLTRVSPTFILGGYNTKCISGMTIGL